MEGGWEMERRGGVEGWGGGWRGVKGRRRPDFKDRQRIEDRTTRHERRKVVVGGGGVRQKRK